MVHVNMNSAAEGGFAPPEPGVHLWEVTKSEAGTSQSQHPKFSVEAERVEGDGRLYDTIMLAGGGWGIGKAKLTALGVPMDFDGDLDPLDLVHRRFWASTGIEEYTVASGKHAGKKREKLKVLIDDLEHCGYQHVDKVPPGCDSPAALDEPPF